MENNDVINCPCGEIVQRNYQTADRITDAPDAYYQWTCPKCGQPFLEKIKAAINIDELPKNS